MVNSGELWAILPVIGSQRPQPEKLIFSVNFGNKQCKNTLVVAE
ncbi:hypothetical protein [Calothrix sp. NIES-2098]